MLKENSKSRKLGEIYPLVTGSMLIWCLFAIMIIVMFVVFFSMASNNTLLKAYIITVVSGLVLFSIPVYGFIRQFLSRKWVHNNCLGFSTHGIDNGSVIYIGNRIDNISELKNEISSLVDIDVLGKVADRLKEIDASLGYSGYQELKRPPVVLVIAQPNVSMMSKYKVWKVMGFQIGNRCFIKWKDNNIQRYRSLLGHELGHVILTHSIHKSTSFYQHLMIEQSGLDRLFEKKDSDK